MILQILKHTPLWVFGLFLGLAYIGYLQSRTRSVSRFRLAVLPVAMLCLSLLGVWSSFGADFIAFFAWASALVTIIAFGLKLPQSRGASYSAESQLFNVPGSWMPLALMMSIFFTKYAVAVARAVSVGHSLPVAATAIVCAVCGLCSGMFFVRALRVIRVAQSSTGHSAAA